MRPDLLKKKLDYATRKDVRLLDQEQHDVVKEILSEQGLLKDG